ncbi:hypothetical protein D4F80_02860 [Salmonella enterica subsp. enterica serovar Adabraka]|nr:hypothetical protein [Salmonella enterica subsp. enterica serovar Vuadens]EBW5402055.1 hypothetical protein [Salmonella enterica subsp. enterica serovar Southampton]EBW5404059.1 hypothetical protein [Salmonella enterica subsp. enterica serovar Southampton]EBY3805370.1 hypothetical protein [Salmonella enterica subsp. enterica serovar Adabraka]HAD6748956.1 hypothetical protein [Salmonella enterica subsp. enterica serovar Typhimurium str. SL1344]
MAKIIYINRNSVYERMAANNNREYFLRKIKFTNRELLVIASFMLVGGTAGTIVFVLYLMIL